MDSGVFALAVIGTIYAEVASVPRVEVLLCIAKWDGSASSTLGTGITAPSPFVEALTVMGTDLYVGGQFNNAGGVSVSNIARWNGSDGRPRARYKRMIQDAGRIGTDVYAGGFFATAGGAPLGVAKWNRRASPGQRSK